MDRDQLSDALLSAVDRAERWNALAGLLFPPPVLLVRDQLRDVASAELDAALLRLERDGHVRLLPASDEKKLDSVVREAAVPSVARGPLVYVRRTGAH